MNDEESKNNNEALQKLPRPEFIEKVVEVQMKQIELQHEELSFRKEELEFQKQQSKQGFDYANKVLEANVEDLKTVRTTESINGVRTAFLITLFVLLSFGFFFFALWMNKEAVVFEILEKVAYIVGGGGAVIIYNKVRKKDDPAEFDDEDIEQS